LLAIKDLFWWFYFLKNKFFKLKMTIQIDPKFVELIFLLY
tara:strand:- start:9122 stop:9241 length:120 start_codon:yes stop_codon:yes gene_type:complete